ncbi:hypothetical protein [Spirosoma pomorum]
MKTLSYWLLLVAGGLACGTTLAQKPGNLNKTVQTPGKSTIKNQVSGALANSDQGNKTAFASSTPISKEQMTLVANGVPLNDLDVTAISSNLIPENKDPLGNYLKQGQSATPMTYGLTYKSWVIFDEWLQRMAVCMDRCEAFWDAYPATRTATTKKQMVATLGYGENETKAFMDVLKANADFSSIFLFYDAFVTYYNTMDYQPMRKYAGKATFQISWLALDPYDFYIAILQNNLSMIDAKESSGKNRGNVRKTSTFIPATK